MKKVILLLILTAVVAGCSSAPIKKDKYSSPEFSRDKYLGKWYEIARKDSWFEKGLSNVTAEYSLKPNGNIKVKNSGFRDKKNKMEVAIGNAKGDKSIPNVLYVSFFGPFYADYIVLDYDRENYSYALVRSKTTDYLWILSRTPVLDKNIVDALIKKAQADGIPTDDLIFVDQSRNTK